MFELTILSIFRQSESYLPRYLSQVREAFALRGGSCHAVWLEGDSEDHTFSMLQAEKEQLEKRGHQVTLVKFDINLPKWDSVIHPSRWLQLAACWNKCMDYLLPSKFVVCVESDLIWNASIIEELIGKLDEEHHLICPMLMAESWKDLFGVNRFNDVWGFSRNGKKFRFFFPYWDSDPTLIEEAELLQISTGGGMLVSTYDIKKQGRWALDCCIMKFPSKVKIFMDKTLTIYHPLSNKIKHSGIVNRKWINMKFKLIDLKMKIACFFLGKN